MFIIERVDKQTTNQIFVSPSELDPRRSQPPPLFFSLLLDKQRQDTNYKRQTINAKKEHRVAVDTMARRRGNKKKSNQQQQQQQQEQQHRQQQRSPKIVDVINESDDEEIPEDEAFNSEDERLYGHFFKNDGDDSGDNDDSESSEDEEEDQDEEEESDERGNSKNRKKKRSELDSSEDEEVTSDEGESESENENDESESSDEDDDDDDDEDGGQYMLDLLNRIEDATKSNKNGDKNGNDVSSLAKLVNVSESNYSAKQGNVGGSLTLDKLMEGIQDTQGFRDLQKTFANQQSATPAPLAKTISSRVERKIAYEERSKDMKRWTKVMQENRRAETLDFKPKDRLGELTRDAIVDKFEAKTDFEKEIEQALEDAGQQDEDAVLKAEEKALQDDLGANKLTMEEYKKRRGQLAQIRALMFYHEQKRHHIKKIKSKKYRRIRKKQRERLKESEMEAAMQDDEELARELQEKEETARIQERMTLAHKNTSKWAKRILKRGKNVTKDERRELSAQLKRGDDLRRKMMGDDDDDDGDSDNEDLADSTRKVLQTIEDGPDPTHGRAGLFKLSFMQKAIQKQREKARDEAQELLDTINADEKDDYDEAMQNDEYDDGTNPSSQKKVELASAKEMKSVLGSGEMVATPLEFGNSNSIATSGGIEIDMGDDDIKTSRNVTLQSEKDNSDPVDEKEAGEGIFGASQFETTMNIKATQEQKGKSKKRKAEASSEVKETKRSPSTKATVATVARDADDDDEANPWLQASEITEDPETPTTKSKKTKRSKGVIDIEGAVDMLDDSHSKRPEANKTGTVSTKDGKDSNAPEKKLTMFSQEELIRQAFVKESDKAIDEEFQREKEEMANDEDPTRKVKKDKKSGDVDGWGSWAGQGVAFPSKPRKLPKKLQAPKKKLEDKSRPDYKKPNVIINTKRIKKTANKFMLGDVPYPYSSRAEYEEAMLGGVGKEWNVSSSFKNMTRPEILTRSGKIIQPISKKAKTHRPAAKF